jgi:hypothetical protein
MWCSNSIYCDLLTYEMSMYRKKVRLWGCLFYALCCSLPLLNLLVISIGLRTRWDIYIYKMVLFLLSLWFIKIKCQVLSIWILIDVCKYFYLLFQHVAFNNFILYILMEDYGITKNHGNIFYFSAFWENFRFFSNS